MENAMKKILLILGLAFVAIGGCVGGVFLGVSFSFGDSMMLPFVLIPGLFVVMGIAFISVYVKGEKKIREIRRKGQKFSAKIYGYVQDHSVVVNGAYPVNVKVHYFDQTRTEREAILPVQFAAGSQEYPIGMTIDIYEYQGKYAWDKGSVRDETLPGEDELMDNRPVEPEKLKYIALTCPNCGASFKAAVGFASKCPYCGGFTDARQ